ncbi:ribokinase [Aureimonas sp. SA4125]|uniref:ribokinase n=1 Tax=Aureimonas sp. SA4125 TaxID=2826993 RepID=UPI001CC572FB|nr:ribokinase [Aureimonas sp. SA4125]BDA84833.1 ribokinase [Aureimonas sp. SA4125]
MATRIAVIGSNMMDLVTYGPRMPAPGETLAADSFVIGHGGKGANQAVAAARLGCDVVMVTKVGDDPFAEQQIENFRANGVRVDHVGRVAGVSSGVAPIFVDHTGENAILIVKGANDHLLPGDVDAAADALSSCRLILLQMEVPVETVYHAIAFGKARGIEVLLNPAPAAADLDVEKIRDVSFLVPNETELALLSGLPVDTQAAVETAAQSLIAKGIKTVIVTMGSRGALLVTAEAVRQIAPVAVEPVDTTGAGDAFIGAFAHFYAAGGAVEASLRQAARYAALSITRRGTQASYLTADEFRQHSAA